MRNISRKWLGSVLAMMISLFGLSYYLNNSTSYTLDEMSAFLATCGTFVQSNFSNVERGQGDYFIVLVSVVVVVFTLYYSMKYLISPGENDESHIKNQILDE